jgi:DUF4097 and DUF4098 domain-containing protein YvlB
MKQAMIHQSNYKFLLFAACLAIGIPLAGQTYENSRSVREAFRVAPNTEVQVINKYGDIHMVPWEKDSVVFEISLSVTSNKQSKVDKIFDYIDFDFKSTAYYVIAQTVFEGQNTIWNEMADVASTIFSSGTNTRIDYTVYFPANNDTRIENKFGNIYTTDHTGKVDITLSNGDMKGHTFSGPTRMKIEFGSVTIDRIVNANIVLGYAELNLENAGEITFETRSSKIYVTDCEKLHLDSRRDRYYIKSAGELNGDAFFSYINLDNVNTKVNLKTSYGDFKLLQVSPEFLRMDLASQYTDLTIYFDQEHLFEFDITRDDRSQVVVPASVISNKEEPVAGMEKTFRSVSIAGNPGKQKVPVMINIKSGKVYLMEL